MIDARVISIDLKVPDQRHGRFPESSLHSKFIIRRKHVESTLIPSLKSLNCFSSVIPFEAITLENKPWTMTNEILSWEGEQIRYESFGSVGCFLSHLCLWRQCVESGNSVLILEDDAALPAESIKNVTDSLCVFDTVGDDNFVLYLQSKDPSYKDVIKNYAPCYLSPCGEALLHLSHCVDMAGTAAYCIKPKAAALLIGKTQTVGMRTVDGFMHIAANDGLIRYLLPRRFDRGFVLNENWDDWNHDNNPDLRANA